MGIEIEIEQSKSLDKGEYTGEITKVEQKNQGGYDYTIISVKEDESEVELSLSVPSKLTPQSSLGNVVSRFVEDDVQDIVGETIDLEEVLVGKNVEYMVVKEETERNGNTLEFSKIVQKSLEPVE